MDGIYCAYTNLRKYGAQRRNYNNCLECKGAHKGCKMSKGPKCDRCTEMGKSCSLEGTVNSVNTLPNHNSESADRAIADYERRFGKILYVKPCSDGHVELIHVKMGNNGVDQVFLSTCDSNYVPVASANYLGPWAEFSNKLRESIATVQIEDMLNMLDSTGE